MTKTLRTVAAFTGVVTALKVLAAARGHDMARTVRDETTSAAIQCRKCERWIVLNIPLNGGGDAPELRGEALLRCPGTKYRPVSSDAVLTSNFLADGTMS